MDWKACDDPKAMLDLVSRHATNAQATYLFLAAMERIRHLLTPDALAGMAEMERQWCDGVADVDHGKIVKGKFCQDRGDRIQSAKWAASDCYSHVEDMIHPLNIVHTLRGMDWSIFDYIQYAHSLQFGSLMAAADLDISWLCPLIREVFPPMMMEEKCAACTGSGSFTFLEVTACACCFGTGKVLSAMKFDSAWITPSTLGIAQQIQDSRDFSGMPILYDALLEAGCDSDPVLDHCRMDSGHYRGCWLIQAIRGNGGA